MRAAWLAVLSLVLAVGSVAVYALLLAGGGWFNFVLARVPATLRAVRAL